MRTIADRGRKVMAKTNSDLTFDTLTDQRWGRYCFGAFMLGWQPGSSYFKYGPSYAIGEVNSDPAEARPADG